MENKQNKMDVLRHSLSHILAAAVLELFPKAKFGIGPTIDDGFYYDFDLPRPLTPEDLPIIEEKMRALIKQNLAFKQEELAVAKATALFQKTKQNYKVELIKELSAQGQVTSDKKKLTTNHLPLVTLYKTGSFVDLCRGPHIKSTNEIPVDAFKLMKISGAYWRGSEKNKMLQRIYGTAWKSKTDLESYLKRIEEAEKRDHRKLGKELELFLIDPTVGMGLVMWQPKGALLWHIMEEFWYKEHLKNGYELVRSPHIGSRQLWETSGHWGFYADSMYPPMEVGRSLDEVKAGKKATSKEEYLIKAMNCPFHLLICNARLRSYKELPLRWAESAAVYRYEKSGELSGLTRVRGFTQDDAHIICTKSQVKEELKRVIDFILYMLGIFGFKDYAIYLSLRDPKNKAKYAGDDEGWKFTERVLEEAAKEKGLVYQTDIGEAAFYGPKLDFKIKDCLGREWQCSTLQFDFNMPEKFDVTFINDQGKKERPYMLHRALFGSFERFIGVLIEHYAGAFPVWLAPEQIWILPVGSRHEDYAKQVADKLRQDDIRVIVKSDNETIGKKIRDGENQKIPYLLIVGDKEISADSVAVRERDKGDLGPMKLDKFTEKILGEIKNKN
ncbi:MAG TPA: threonine--tRNA ligase [Candidatus Portnoybacteria bacterium]|nr:threonine--tRNA ligase [Candidatus Portnoybacteria bacterium]